MALNKTIVIKARKGNIVEEYIVEKEYQVVIKEVAIKALNEWDPLLSNFDIMKYDYSIEKPLPLKPEEVDIIMDLSPRREKGKVVFSIPMYIVSYKNYKIGDQLIDEEVYVVAPYIGDEYKKYVYEVGIMATAEEEESGEE